MNYKKTIIGSSLAFIVATSCCWLPALLLALGGGSAAMALSDGLQGLSLPFLALGVLLSALAFYQYKKRRDSSRKELILESTITCPECDFESHEVMPTDACQYFYECKNCHTVLKPRDTHCCVFCSYGTVPCPPIQKNEDCC